jgi:hypothetical protein
MLKTTWIRFETKQRKEAQHIRSLIYQQWGKPFGKDHGIGQISRQDNKTYSFNMATSSNINVITNLREPNGSQPVLTSIKSGQCRISAREKDTQGNIRFHHLGDIAA